MDRVQPAIYILTNTKHSVLYVGVTSNLLNRIYQHKYLKVPGFASKYKCVYLVYYEVFEFMVDAIAREKQIKAGSREKK